MIKTETTQIPLWITITSSLMALLGLFVGASLYLSPGTFLPDIDFSLPASKYLSQMWAARQIAIALIIAHSLIRKSPAMLMVSLMAYAIMNIQDACIGLSKHDAGLACGATFFFLLPAVMIFVLRKRVKTE